METRRADEAWIHDCLECGSTLAHDQRYCVACGARRGPLPAHIAHLIGAIFEQGRRVSVPVTAEAKSLEPVRGRFDAWLGAPRAAAVAVMGMLGFGVVVGSLVSGSAANAISPIIVALSPSSPHQTSSSLGAGSGAGGAGGSGGTVTITTTTPAPPTPTGPSAATANVVSAAPGGAGSTSTPTNLPPIKHVFLIMLSNEGFSHTFNASATDPYLAKTLAKKGEVIDDYYAVAGGALANEIALTSGQGPTPQTVDDCPQYKNVEPGIADTNGQVLGTGCVYPKSTKTLADQLTKAHLSWKAYVQTAASQKQAKPEMCHPALGSSPPGPTPSSPYATWRNPFLYFHSVIGKTACPKNNVTLGQLHADLRSASTTPALSYIVPDICDDSSADPCSPGPQGQVAASDAFLRSVVPEIMSSPAYKADGMIVITFDQAPQSGPYADSSSCCGNPTYPNLSSSDGAVGPSGTTGATGPTGTTGATGANGPQSTTLLSGGATSPTGGGGQVGLLLLSRYVKPGLPDVTDYFNHFSLLASIEGLLGLKPLGYASDPSLPVFGAAVYDAYTPG